MFFKIAGSPYDGSKKALPTAKLKMCIQIFLVNLNEAAGSGTWDKVRAMLTRCSSSIGTKKRPDGIKPYERNRVYFAV